MELSDISRACCGGRRGGVRFLTCCPRRVHTRSRPPHAEITEKYREEVCGIAIGDDADHPLAAPIIVKLSNNALTDVTGLDTALAAVADLSKVTTLDLSFNKVTTMEGAFDCFPSLKRLFLHGNEVAAFAEVLHLQTDCPAVRTTQQQAHGRS